jgi:hypothetical protein
MMDFLNKIGSGVYAEIAQKQKDFASNWVSNGITKPAIRAILWYEYSYLNESTKLKLKRRESEG